MIAWWIRRNKIQVEPESFEIPWFGIIGLVILRDMTDNKAGVRCETARISLAKGVEFTELHLGAALLGFTIEDLEGRGLVGRVGVIADCENEGGEEKKKEEE
ncbi:MAG: hypothetical protein Q9220_004790, partial [cf. Caloplaca sp. 1 TL-2023]